MTFPSKLKALTALKVNSIPVITEALSLRWISNRKTDRKFNRIELNARIRLSDDNSNEWLCTCVSFSEDSIDVSDLTSVNSSQLMVLKIGTRISLQIVGVENAPILQVVVVKTGPDQLGFKFMKKP